MDKKRILLSRKEAAERLGVSVGWLETLHRQGGGPPYYKPSPRLALYDLDTLDRWLESTLVVPGQKEAAQPGGEPWGPGPGGKTGTGKRPPGSPRKKKPAGH